MNINTTLTLCQKDKKIFLEKRIKLLKEIQKTGSILQAAKNIPMSYKSAWDAIELMNNLSTHPILERQAGGKSGGGSSLTKYGEKLVHLYEVIKENQQHYMEKISQQIDFESADIQNLERISMEISARNVFVGRVKNIVCTDVSALVTIDLKGAREIVSSITQGAVKNLSLEEGVQAKAIIKSSSVMIGKSSDFPISARNIIQGTIINIKSDDVQSEISLDIGANQTLVSTITTNSLKRLGFKIGDTAYGIIKSNSVMIGK